MTSLWCLSLVAAINPDAPAPIIAIWDISGGKMTKNAPCVD